MSDHAGKLGTFSTLSIGIGGMVGGGIFATTGLAVQLTKGAIPIAFVTSGIVALLTSYSYLKLTLRFPGEGGTVEFLNRGFGTGILTGAANILLPRWAAPAFYSSFLVYPGVGWVVWRSHDELPEELIFHVNYLGGDMPTFTLNFSRPGNQIVGQYYNFLRLGRAGYTQVMKSMRETAVHLSSEIEKLGPFELLSRGDEIPVFAFALKNPSAYTVFDLSEKLREYGWQVPAYTMPPKVDDMAVMRVCVREGFGRNLADVLLTDLKAAVDHFNSQDNYRSPHRGRRGKTHKIC